MFGFYPGRSVYPQRMASDVRLVVYSDYL